MKRGTPRHPKVSDLATALKKEMYAAVGILELLWHFTAEYAPRGDIGRHTDIAIAKAVHWRGNPAKLIDALVQCRLLDLSQASRLVVHDWADHADDATHMKLARAREFFFDGGLPSTRRLSGQEKLNAVRFYEPTVRTESTQDALSGEGRAGEGLGKGSGKEKKDGEILRPEWDEQFLDFKAIFAKCSVDPLIQQDWDETWYPWHINDFEQKKAIVESVYARLAAGQQIFHKPKNYISKHEYKRPARPIAVIGKRTVLDEMISEERAKNAG